eukprot:7512254-Heterocapsa_arctica.AAC.1
MSRCVTVKYSAKAAHLCGLQSLNIKWCQNTRIQAAEQGVGNHCTVDYELSTKTDQGHVPKSAVHAPCPFCAQQPLLKIHTGWSH